MTVMSRQIIPCELAFDKNGEEESSFNRNNIENNDVLLWMNNLPSLVLYFLQDSAARL